MKINVLPQSIANMIAAGEVVERPASVVKELAENSIDAGAGAVTIEIKKGGMSYIRITDDGCGIAPDEVLTAFKRHATSKIKTEEDLNSIYTLGFRGEALASIAAVARVDIFTKQKDDSFGYSASIEGGEVVEHGEAGCPDGTTITVRDLFFNTPARMKFLKSDATETSYVTDSVQKLILSHPEVEVKLIVNGKITLSSPGDGNGESAIRAIFGRDYISHLNKLDFDEDGIKVSGFVGTNAIARKDRRQQIFFINGRYIRSKIISAALSEAYQNTMMVGRFPFAVVFINLSGSLVDVNVHPTKVEVRFSDDKKIYNSVFWAVKNALSSKKYIPEINIEKKAQSEKAMSVQKTITAEKNKSVQVDINLLKDTYIKSLDTAVSSGNKIPQAEKIKEDTDKTVAHRENRPLKADTPETFTDLLKSHIEENTFFVREDMLTFNEPPVDKTGYCAPRKTEVLPEDASALTDDMPPKPVMTNKLKCGVDFAIVGQIFDTYIICQMDNRMIIIDQHAAHERIYFEELMDEYLSKDMKSQMLMIPVTVDFDPIEFDVVVSNLNLLIELGFDCEEFGSSSIIVRSVPSAMNDTEIGDTVRDIAELIRKGTVDIKKTLMEEILHTMACKRALKGNTRISREEMETLAEKVLSFDSINTCPHGRPIITSMTKYELEKNFKRIV